MTMNIFWLKICFNATLSDFTDFGNHVMDPIGLQELLIDFKVKKADLAFCHFSQ